MNFINAIKSGDGPVLDFDRLKEKLLSDPEKTLKKLARHLRERHPDGFIELSNNRLQMNEETLYQFFWVAVRILTHGEVRKLSGIDGGPKTPAFVHPFSVAKNSGYPIEGMSHDLMEELQEYFAARHKRSPDFQAECRQFREKLQQTFIVCGVPGKYVYRKSGLTRFIKDKEQKHNKKIRIKDKHSRPSDWNFIRTPYCDSTVNIGIAAAKDFEQHPEDGLAMIRTKKSDSLHNLDAGYPKKALYWINIAYLSGIEIYLKDKKRGGAMRPGGIRPGSRITDFVLREFNTNEHLKQIFPDMEKAERLAKIRKILSDHSSEMKDGKAAKVITQYGGIKHDEMPSDDLLGRALRHVYPRRARGRAVLKISSPHRLIGIIPRTVRHVMGMLF